MSIVNKLLPRPGSPAITQTFPTAMRPGHNHSTSSLDISQNDFGSSRASDLSRRASFCKTAAMIASTRSGVLSQPNIVSVFCAKSRRRASVAGLKKSTYSLTDDAARTQYCPGFSDFDNEITICSNIPSP